MSTNEKLKPCPFCGADAEYDSQRWMPVAGTITGHTGHSIYCSSDECFGQAGIHDTEEEAVKAWNTRERKEGV